MKTREEFTKKQILQFNTFAEKANKNNAFFKRSLATSIELVTLIRFMPNLSKSTVLDMGCGTGRFVIPLAQRAKVVHGIDLSKHSIDVLRTKAKKEGLTNVDVKIADIRTYHSSNRYDYILMVNVLHHVQDIQSLLKNIQSMLKTSGTLVLFEFNPLNPLFIPAFILSGQFAVHMNKEYLRSNIWSLLHVLSQTGYEVISKYRHAFLPTSLYNISPVFIKINKMANSIPILNQFCAFHIVTCKIQPYDTKI